MNFALHTEAYDAEFPLENEVKQMQQVLYPDIPIEERARYCELEKLWTSKREFQQEYVTSSFKDEFLPIGINSYIAVALSNMGDAKKHMIGAELEQYHLFWKAMLRRCRFKVQFTEKMKLILANSDPNLKRIAEMIVRDTDLIAFRDSLPEVIVDEGINSDTAERKDSEVITVAEVANLPSGRGSASACASVYSFYYQRYTSQKTREWKCSKHVFTSVAAPMGAISENYLVYAFYESETDIVVRLCGFDQKTPLEEWKIVAAAPRSPPLLRCAVNNQGWMAVSIGTAVYHKCIGRPLIYRHTIEDQIVSAVHVDVHGFLQMGTTNGQLYDVSPFKLRSYSKDRDLIAIVSISSSGSGKLCAQSVCGLFVPAPSENFVDKHFNIMRPLTCLIRGPLVFFLTKYGTLKVRSTIHDGGDIELPILKGMTANIDYLPPWYDRGIYFDGKTCAVLYPSGAVLVRVIKE